MSITDSRTLRWLAALLAVGTAGTSSAATFVVTSTADTAGSTCGSTCTLRQAITAANLTATADTINFAIPISIRVQRELTISPASPLPNITQPLTIDGYSQSGTSVNANASASTAQLRIRIDGGNAGPATNGLAICADDVTLRGLSLTGFGGSGIAFGRENTGTFCPDDVEGGIVAGNFIGLATDGSTADGNATGISITGSTARIGGSSVADRNVIGANTGAGVLRVNAAATPSVIDNNLIGTDRSGTLDRGNGRGIQLSTSAADTLIGLATRPNLIAHNGIGIQATNSQSGNTWFANRIFANDDLGIDLGTTGVLANDGNDADNGPNGLQNFPEIETAVRTPTGVTVTGRLDVGHAGVQTYRIALYASADCDPSGHGEGEQLLSDQPRALSASTETFTFSSINDPLPPGSILTMTATSAGGSTSEFSACIDLDPPPLVVNSSADPGTGTCDATECTLREAIQEVNARAVGSLNVIEFDIPGPGPHTISPSSAFPTLVRQVTIDGYSQLGASPNTLAQGSDAVIRIRIDGALAGSGRPGLALCADNITVRGLSITGFGASGVISGFDSNGVQCVGEFSGVTVGGNFIGLAADGATAAGNAGSGVFFNQTSGVIGGIAPGDRNVIGANAGSGIGRIRATDAPLSILGNLIGTDRTGLLDRGNAEAGVSIDSEAAGVEVGAGNAPNLIAHNAVGVEVRGTGTGNAVLANRITANDALGIDLGGDGVTPNDPEDADIGPNALQNFPVLTAAQRSAQGLSMRGELDLLDGDPTPNDYLIAIYANTACDASGHGEGERYLGAVEIDLDGSEADGRFAFELATDDALPPGTFITATATRTVTDNTSEFSACIEAIDPPPGFVVNTTTDTDDGTCNASHCSLREAIAAANAQGGPDQISFNLAGEGPFTLDTSILPRITESVVIDGYTQLGASKNTAATGTNAVLLIELTGGVIDVCAGDSTVSGIAFGDFAGVLVRTAAAAGCSSRPSDVRILGNFFGSGPDGNGGGANSSLEVVNAVARVGGPDRADLNLFTGAASFTVSGANAAGTHILGNLFGTDRTGTLDLGDGGASLSICNGAQNVRVGDPASPNLFRFSQSAVAVCPDSAGHRLFANEFADHDTIAINLCPEGVCSSTPKINDADDADTGGNNLQNFPVLGSGVAFVDRLVINGLLDVPAATSNAPYTIALYESAACSPSGNGEGEILLGTRTVSLSGGAENFSVTLDVPPPAPGRVITATATDPLGNTSEFSACLTAPVILTVFADGFEG